MLIEDHPILRIGIRELIESAPGLQVVAETGDGNLAVESAVESKPDVVITDVNLPGKHGIQIVTEISSQKELSDTKVVVLTSHDSEEQIFCALKAGAHGYASKDIMADHLLDTVRGVIDGKYVINGRSLPLTSKYRQIQRYAIRNGFDSKLHAPLTNREHQILSCIASGMPNEEIASLLGIKSRTVRVHLFNAFGKLGVSDRTQAAITMIKRGWN